MRWIVWTIVALVAIVGVVAVVGWMLPVAHEASRSAHFNRPPDEVYRVVADVAGYARWFDGVTEIDMLGAPDRKVRFRQHTTSGPIVMEVDEAQPPSRFVTRIADPDQPFGGTWTFEIARANGGARLTITERGEIYNPIFRFMARFIFGYTSTMENYLRSLQTRLSG